MASILIGSGEQQLRVEGDVMRIDRTAQKLSSEAPASAPQTAKLSSLSEPADDAYISELPKAIRQTKEEGRSSCVLRSDVGAKRPYVFVYWEPSVSAWLPLAEARDLPENALVAYYIGDSQVVFNGIYYYPSDEVGKEIYCRDFYLGKVIASEKAFIHTL